MKRLVQGTSQLCPPKDPQKPERAIGLIESMGNGGGGHRGIITAHTAGNLFLLTVVDHYTRYAEVFPIPDQFAETVARVLMEMIVAQPGEEVTGLE